MRKMKKLLSLLLIAALLVSIVPMAAVATPAPEADLFSQIALLSDDEFEIRPNPFTDVNPNNWFYDYVRILYHFDVMTGTTATTFAPNGTLTRAMVVAILYRLEYSPTPGCTPAEFSDVPESAWFAPYVTWAASWGIVEGVGGGRFAPNASVTREQFAVMLYRFTDGISCAYGIDMSVPASFTLDQFTDSGQISAWARDAMRWVAYHEIVTGTTATTITPGGTATRAQCAAMIVRFMLMIADQLEA